MTKKNFLFWLVLLCLLPGGLTAKDFQHTGSGTLVEDTATINRMLERAYLLRERNTDSALYLNNLALASARQLHYDAGICDAWLGLSRTHAILNQNELSIADTRNALRYCTHPQKKYEQEANAYLSLAFVYYYEGRYDSCAWYRYRALNLVETGSIKNLQVQLTAYSSVLQFWITVHSDIRNDAYIQNIMRHINDIEKTAIATGDSASLAEVYFRKASYYGSCGQGDSLRYYSNLTIAMAQRLKSTPSVTIASLLNSGESYLDENRPEEALAFFRRAIAEVPEKNKEQNRFYLYALFDIGDAYFQQKKYTLAIETLERALQQAQQLGHLLATDFPNHTLALAYNATGNYAKSAWHWSVYSGMRDSMTREKKMELVYNVEMKYRLADKERELAQKELSIAINENKIKIRNIWIGIILTFTTLIIVLGLLFFRNNKNKQKLQSEKIRNLHQELAIGNLQAMIAGEEKERSRIARDLHDGMGGTLAVIRTRLSNVFRKVETDNVQAQTDMTDILLLLEEASAELRKTAHNLMPEILLREGLTNATLLFCERIRKGYMLEITTEIWGEQRRLPDDLELIAYRIIQELIHNIQKHARATQALVQIVYHTSVMSVTVEDNGTGIHENNTGQNEGTGLKNIRERVTSLHGVMDISATAGKGTSIYIELPLDDTGV